MTDAWDDCIFIYLLLYHKNQPFMQVNIPVPWMVWVFFKQLPDLYFRLFIPPKKAQTKIHTKRSDCTAGIELKLSINRTKRITIHHGKTSINQATRCDRQGHGNGFRVTHGGVFFCRETSPLTLSCFEVECF